jgi:O-methyltransferase
MIRRILHKLGVDIVRYKGDFVIPADFDESICRIARQVQPYTATSPERLFALCNAIAYLSAQKIPGSIVECGVWKGGSMMAAALSLLQLNDASRDLYLFDTYEGLPTPGKEDVSIAGAAALDEFKAQPRRGEFSRWFFAPLEEVRRNVLGTGYDGKKLHFVKGKVEDTIPTQAPSQIALLRLDTDWYESTRHELIHLFPRVNNGGVIIIDDYGYWKGARKAVDEYIIEHKIPILLNRIDGTGRIGIVQRKVC